jgi:hypothetical protein
MGGFASSIVIPFWTQSSALALVLASLWV